MPGAERPKLDPVPLAGVLAVALFLVGSLLPGAMPKPDASTQTVVDVLAVHRSMILIGNALILLAVPFFALFVGSLLATLRQADSPRAELTTATAFGWVILIALVAVGFLVQTALVWRGTSVVTPELVRFGIATRSGINAAGYAGGVGPLIWAAWVIARGCPAGC